MKKSNIQEKPNNDGSMSLTGHLKELRNRIVIVLVVLIVGIVACFAYANTIINLLTDMGIKYNYVFVYLRPQELLLSEFNISLLGGFVITFPLLAYQIYAFSSPGLKKKEKTFMIFALTFGIMCFCIGVFFAYKVMLPFMLRFLISFSNHVDISASISIQEYISFLLLIFVIFGIIFELPVISVLLTSLGLVKPMWLVKARKVMIVLIFVLAAIITPPDIVSQIMVAIPIILLYQLSIWLSQFVYGLKMKRRKAEEDDDEDDDD